MDDTKSRQKGFGSGMDNDNEREYEFRFQKCLKFVHKNYVIGD